MPPHDPHFLDVCRDVTVRYKAHDNYGSRKKALKAFERRAPGFDTKEYAQVFDAACAIYEQAVEAIQRFPSETRHKKKRYAQAEDIDIEKALPYLDQTLPGYALSLKRQLLNWVIFWHYLK